MTVSPRGRLIARSRLLALAAACAIAPTAASAAEVSAPAWALQRSLSALRDRAMWNEEAYVLSLLLTREVAAAFRAVGDEGWDDPRTRAALLAYALSGGNRALVRERLVRIGERLDPGVAEATAAYLSRPDDAAAQLAEAVALFPETVRPLVHLAIGALDPMADDAPMHLLRAELLAPGTLIEEAALRRRIALPPHPGLDAGDWHHAALGYLRRFGGTRGGPATIRPIARGFAVHGAEFEPADMRGVIDAAPTAMREALALEIARECVLSGHAALARAALADQRNAPRRRLYTAAAGPLDVPDVPALALPDPRDQSLLLARQALGEAIRRAPEADAVGNGEVFSGVEDALRAARFAREGAE